MRNFRAYLPSTVLAVIATAALAHAQLEKATPAVGSTVAGATEIKLEFGEGVEPKFSSVTLTSASGAAVAVEKPVVAGNPKVLSVKISAPLAAGMYTVNWKAVSTDTHRTQGSFTFTVKP